MSFPLAESIARPSRYTNKPPENTWYRPDNTIKVITTEILPSPSPVPSWFQQPPLALEELERILGALPNGSDVREPPILDPEVETSPKIPPLQQRLLTALKNLLARLIAQTQGGSANSKHY